MLAALAKINTPAHLQAAVATLGRVGKAPVRTLGAIEGCIGLCLIVRAGGIALVATAATLLIALTAALLWLRRLNGGVSSCGCYGESWDRLRGRFDIPRNALLLAFIGLIVVAETLCKEKLDLPPSLHLTGVAAGGVVLLATALIVAVLSLREPIRENA